MGVGVVLNIAWLGGVCSLTGAEVVDLQDHAIRLRDVVQLDCAPASSRENLGELIVATLNSSSDQVVLQLSELADLVRRRAPGLAFEAEHGSERSVLLRAGEAPLASSQDVQCFALSRGVRAGAAISADDLAPAPCANQVSRSLYYEANEGVVRAASDLPEGAYVGRLSVPAHAFPDAGDMIVLSVRLGPVQVDRQVEAIQPAPNGGTIFVRDESGVVFRAPVSTDAGDSNQ